MNTVTVETLVAISTTITTTQTYWIDIPEEAESVVLMMTVNN
jgi:hypothetical protein